MSLLSALRMIRVYFAGIVAICTIFVPVSVCTQNISSAPVVINAEEIPNTLPAFPAIVVDSERDLKFRALLCSDVPKSLLPFYRFHLTTRTCYQTETQGPCGSNMIFVKESFTRAIGKCICNPVIGQHRPLVRHRETNQCYFLYTQGYCEPDEWLVPISGENINRDSNSYWAVCRKNQCQTTIPQPMPEYIHENSTNSNSTGNSTINPEFTQILQIVDTDRDENFVMHMGNCAKLGFPTEFCPENETLNFRDGILTCVLTETAIAELEDQNGEEISEETIPMPTTTTTIATNFSTEIETTENPAMMTEIPPIPVPTPVPAVIAARAAILNSIPPVENENEITASEFLLRRRRRRRSILFRLFPRHAAYGFQCPEGTSLNFISGRCQVFRVWNWNWNPRQENENEDK